MQPCDAGDGDAGDGRQVSGYRGSVGIHHPSSVRLLSDAEPHLPRWEDALNRCLDEIRSEIR